MTLWVRHRGTALYALFSWFSGTRLRALLSDLGAHVGSLFRGHLPTYEETGPLAFAVHGLGLLLMTTMAISGGVYAAQVWTGTGSPEPDGSLAMTIHFAFANLVWVDLIAHAGMATVHRFGKSASLGKMWTL